MTASTCYIDEFLEGWDNNQHQRNMGRSSWPAWPPVFCCYRKP